MPLPAIHIVILTKEVDALVGVVSKACRPCSRHFLDVTLSYHPGAERSARLLGSTPEIGSQGTSVGLNPRMRLVFVLFQGWVMVGSYLHILEVSQHFESNS